MNTKEDAINLHRMLKGKIEIHNKVSVENAFDEEKGTLGLIYTPGVAYVSTEISNNKELAYDYTSKWNNVAKLSIKLFIYKCGPTHEEMEDVL